MRGRSARRDPGGVDGKQIRDRYAKVLSDGRELQQAYVEAKAKLHELRGSMQANDAEKAKLEAGAELLDVSLEEVGDVDVPSA